MISGQDYGSNVMWNSSVLNKMVIDIPLPSKRVVKYDKMKEKLVPDRKC